MRFQMASLTEVQAALQRDKRAKRNLSRLKSYYEHEQRDRTACDQLCKKLVLDATEKSQQLIASANERGGNLVLDATEKSQQLIVSANERGGNLVLDAKREAATILESSKRECALLMKQKDELEQVIGRQKASLHECATQQFTIETSREAKKVRDSRRKRLAYWSTKQARASKWRPGVCSDPVGIPNRKLRAVNGALGDVNYILTRLYRFNKISKKLLFERFWLHRSLRPFQPTAYGCPRLDASVGATIVDLKQPLRIVKVAKRKDHLATKRALLTALVGKSTVSRRYQSSLAKALGIKRQNLHRASKTRERIDEDKSLKYPLGERKIRSDKISDVVCKAIEQYWESNTRISPCAKDQARRRLARKVYEEHRVHWLEDTEVEFFIRFQDWCKTQENGIDIGLRSFQLLKPYYVRTMKDWMVCYYKQHVEMDLLKDALNKFRKFHHCKNCTCECATCKSVRDPLQSCTASQMSITSVRGWIEHALCPKEEGHQWHKKICLMGDCDKCGVKKLNWCTSELDPAHGQLIDWQTFQYVELDERAQHQREKKKGTEESVAKKVKRLRMVYRKTSMIEFKNQVLETVKSFIIHNFRVRWQSEQFKLCLKTFPRGTIVSSIDFSENYTFKPQNKIQSMHWDNRQITLLIHVTYRHRQDASMSLETAVGRTVAMAQDEDETRDIIADYHFYISDNNLHDTLMVQHCLDSHNKWMKDQRIEFDQHWVWSDGAASQFKSCRPFYYVARYYSRFGARMKWYFHASGHGKGVADTLGGHIKQGLEREQLKGIHGRLLENAHDVVKFCEDKFALGQVKEYGDVQLVRRLFWEIPVGAVNRKKKWDCDPIKGSRSLHCFDGFSNRLSTLLRVRELCCFCPHCLDDELEECEHVEWTGLFRLEMVTGVLSADVRPDVLSMGVGEGAGGWEEGSLAELVQVGDFYVVQAAQPNNWSADFYISQCEEAVHGVKNDFVDNYDQGFQKGNLVVKGRWFQPVPGREGKFVLNDTAPFGYNLAKSVVHIRFGLIPCEAGKGQTGGARVYSLDTDTLAAIYGSCES